MSRICRWLFGKEKRRKEAPLRTVRLPKTGVIAHEIRPAPLHWESLHDEYLDARPSLKRRAIEWYMVDILHTFTLPEYGKQSWFYAPYGQDRIHTRGYTIYPNKILLVEDAPRETVLHEIGHVYGETHE